MNLLLSKTYFTLGIKNQHCQNKYISRPLLDCQVTIVSISGVRGEMFSGLWGKFLFLLNNFLSKQSVGNLYIGICLTERIFTLTGNYCSTKKNICQDQKQSFTQMAIILLSTFSLPLVQLLNLQSVSMRHGMVVAMNICSCSSKFEYRVQVWVGLKAEKGDRRSRITLSLITSLGLHAGCHDAMLPQLCSEDLILCFPVLHLPWSTTREKTKRNVHQGLWFHHIIQSH